MPIKQFGYIGIRTAKLGEWRTIATQVLGAQCRDDSPDGTLKLRFDSYHHRVTLYDAAEEQVAHYGWQLESQQDLVRYGETLARHGVAWQPGSALECADRAVDSFIHFKDPDGQRVELFVTPHVDASGFQPSRGLGSGFAMDSLGLGHVNLACHDVQATVGFYVDVLGFKLSDFIRWSDADATFLHCNPRHHSLALMNDCFGMQGGQLHHLLVQVKEMDDVGRAYDIVQRLNIPLALTLGRHSNDRMTSFYFMSPSGFAIEYGWGGIEIDDAAWEVRSYDTPRLWGHKLVGVET